MLWTAIYGFLIPIASRGKIAWAMLKQGWRLILKLVRERKALYRYQPRPYPGIVDNQAYHELDSQSRRHVGHSRPGDRALLVKSSIPGRVSRRDDIGAEVAAQLISRNQIGVVTSGRFGAGTLPVPHDEVGVEAESRVDDELVVMSGHDGGQPARLAGVHQQEDNVVTAKKQKLVF